MPFDLIQAVSNFRNAAITEGTGDLNSDGLFTDADLDIVKQYYGIGLTILQGSETLADVDSDGVVGLTDLVFVAEKVENN